MKLNYDFDFTLLKNKRKESFYIMIQMALDINSLNSVL